MSTGATDMAFLRAKGMQCYGVGIVVDDEDAAKGFAAHSDQERIREDSLYEFMQFQWDVLKDGGDVEKIGRRHGFRKDRPRRRSTGQRGTGC